MRNRETLMARVAATAAAALLAGTAATASAAEVKLGALMPMTGGLQAYGEACLHGVELAAEEANAAGGVLGSKVSVVVADTQTKPQPAIDAAKKLVTIDKVAGIIGALSSGNTGPVASSVTSVEGVPQISPASTAPSLTNLVDKDFLYRTVPSDAFQGVALAEIVKGAGIDNVAVMYINNDYGDGLASAFSKAFGTLGGNVSAAGAFEPNKASYRGELKALSGGGAESLVLIAYPDDGGLTIVKQALEEGYFGKFVFTDGMKAEKVVEQIGAQYLNGSIGSAPKALETDAGGMFTKMYEKKYGELPPRPFIDSSYDAAMILMLAMEKAGSTDGTKVRDAIRQVSNPPGTKILPGEFAKAVDLIKKGENIDYVGAAGQQDFDAAGDVSGTFEEWAIEDGKLVTKRVFAPGSSS
ncbi:ABC transporter substrate-binding protein [Marinibaculum pumilum]|uniref:ABC transporter substrate-binding protein n=1 Tax=Marinibaculum pumilum TaxID=1766165 RepID=A0ABV7KWR7_9PROT